MELDPQMKALLDQLAAAGGKPFHEMTPAQAREAIEMLFHAFRSPTPPPVGKVENRNIPGPNGEIPVRIYTPEGSGPFGALLYFHGGGWVVGTLDGYDEVCRNLTRGAGCVTVSVDYRLAPEYKFPAGPEDCYAATQWVAANARTLNVDAERLAVGGDSAGGNLAAVVAQMARDRGGPRLAHQLLIYPAIDAADDTPSQREFTQDGYILSRADMEWFWGHYLNDKDRANPYACPSRARSLAGLPPATVIIAEIDPLRDEGVNYADALGRAGVPASVKHYKGVCHGFVSLAGAVDAGKRAIADCCAGLRPALNK
ncbi:MAG: alpha/beta hydrolase [Candidatus Binataceae bacterium]